MGIGALVPSAHDSGFERKPSPTLRYDHLPSAPGAHEVEHGLMGKRVLIAVLWGLAVWTWVSMAHVFLGIPELGMLAGVVTAAAILGRGVLPSHPMTAARHRQVDSSHSNRSGSHA